MTDFLVRRGLVLRTDLLGAWAGWLTPVFEPKRYRTWFFVATLPGVAGHARRVLRVVVGDVAARRSQSSRWSRGEMLMLPPTYLTCLEVAQYPDASSALSAAASRTVDMFTPEVISSGDDFMLSTPPTYERLLESR